MSSLYISKNSSEIPELIEFCSAHSIELAARSMIQFVPISYDLPGNYEAIFFGSPRAVMFFLAQSSFPLGVEIAAAGNKTKELIESLGYPVGYFGSGSDMDQVALAFSNWLGDRLLFLPHSSRSNKTMLRYLNPEQVIQQAIYTTELQPATIKDCHFYVFTSPSNAEAFLQVNSIPNESTVISWGSTTSEFLQSRGINCIQLSSPDTHSLTELLLK